MAKPEHQTKRNLTATLNEAFEEVTQANPGTLSIDLSILECAQLGGLLNQTVMALLPAVRGGDELALKLSVDCVALEDKIRKAAVAKWGE